MKTIKVSDHVSLHEVWVVEERGRKYVWLTWSVRKMQV